MSTFQTYNYPGWGTWAAAAVPMNQAIRVGDRIHTSGQGGWIGSHTPDLNDPNLIPSSLAEELRNAFDNVELNLKNAGGQGWSQVYKFVTYSIDIPEQHELIVENLQRVFPGKHRPVWTELGVRQLGIKGMRIEIEVEAYDPEGAEKERKNAGN